MRRSLIRVLAVSICLMLTAGALCAQNGNRKVQVAGIAFYNLENLFDTIPNNPEGRDAEFTPDGQRQWDARKYRIKLHNMAYAISQFKTRTTPYGPAIIGVSEIENRSVLEDLVAEPELQDLNLQIVHHDSPDARGVDVGLLYNPRYFRVENVTNHRLDVGFRTRDQMCVVGSLLGQQIAVIVNHWPSRLGGQERSESKRVAAAELSRSIADSLWRVNPNMGVIVLGDLNDDPMDRSCSVTLGAGKERENVPMNQFYNPWWKMLDRGIGTLAYKSSWNLFDQVILSGTFVDGNESRWQFYEARVLNFDFLKDT